LRLSLSVDFWLENGRLNKMENSRTDNKIKVVVGMSGGVDSAVAAGLLQSGGFEVEGFFARLLAGKTEDEKRAAAVCEKLKIPFRVFDLRKEFKKIIIDKFVSDTKKGLTPNPCVACNKEIKFGLLFAKAMEMGADYVATGHYCNIKKTKDGIYHLFKGKDKEKDQSYFLWRLKQKQLKKIIFPLGVFEKSEVKNLAKAWDLPIKENSESQDVCFAGGDMVSFLQKNLGKNPGDVVEFETKEKIGKHDGLWFYTIGQRKGIGLSGGPFYVFAKNFAKNELIVSLNKPKFGNIKLRGVNWISGTVPDMPLKIKAKIRYRGKEAVALLDKKSGACVLEFTRAQAASAPGQSAVLYRGNELIGGGVITAISNINI